MPRSKGKMRIKKMDHSALVVQDLDRSRVFYGEVLGLVEVPRPKSFDFRGAWFRGPTFELHLVHAAETTAPAGFGDPGEGGLTGLAHHLAFEVEDLDEAIACLRSHSVEILSGPMPRGDGVVQIYVLDPDGNFLEFFSWDGDRIPIEEEGMRKGMITYGAHS